MNPFNVLAVIGAGAWLYPIGVVIYRLFLKPKVRITPAETVQIGYTTLGPILNLQCAISTDRKDAVIERIQVKITHEKGDSHILTWKFLDETQSTLLPFSGEGGGYVSKHDIAIALKVSTLIITQKNVHFQDDEFLKEFQAINRQLNSVMSHLKKTSPDNLGEGLVSAKEYTDAIDFLSNGMYWKAGRYSIKLTAQVVALKKTHIEEFVMHLDQSEVDDLKKNIEQFDLAVRKAVLPEEKEPFTESWNWINPKIERLDS